MSENGGSSAYFVTENDTIFGQRTILEPSTFHILEHQVFKPLHSCQSSFIAVTDIT